MSLPESIRLALDHVLESAKISGNPQAFIITHPDTVLSLLKLIQDADNKEKP